MRSLQRSGMAVLALRKSARPTLGEIRQCVHLHSRQPRRTLATQSDVVSTGFRKLVNLRNGQAGAGKFAQPDTLSATHDAGSTRQLLPEPELDVRWVHAGAQHLSLLPTPVKTPSMSYKAFSAQESERMEKQWGLLSHEERKSAIEEWGALDGEGAPAKARRANNGKGIREDKRNKTNGDVGAKAATRPRVGEVENTVEAELLSGTEQDGEGDDKYKAIIQSIQTDSDPDVVRGVPVSQVRTRVFWFCSDSQDSLFEVSFPTLSLHPVFWPHRGPRVPVIRGTWFVGDESKPINWEIAEKLEQAYQKIQPWQPSYQAKLAAAVAAGPGGEERLKYTLPASLGDGLDVIFDDRETGRIIK